MTTELDDKPDFIDAHAFQFLFIGAILIFLYASLFTSSKFYTAIFDGMSGCYLCGAIKLWFGKKKEIPA